MVGYTPGFEQNKLNYLKVIPEKLKLLSDHLKDKQYLLGDKVH